MAETFDRSPLAVRMPVPLALRIIFITIGLFVVGISTWELHRGVWPVNVFSPFFLFIILGAWSVGIPATMAGLFGWAEMWVVKPGRIDIVRRNPFRFWRHRIKPADIASMTVDERIASEGDNTFEITLVTVWGARFKTHDFKTKQAAEALRDRIVAAFGG
jgi:hypothetical protein